MSVRSWPTYLLRGIPPELRQEIEADAEKFQVSMNEVIRSILCQTYRVRCLPVDTERYRKPGVPGTTTMLLQLQPALHRKLVRLDGGKTVRRHILDALEAHYKRGTR